jgi:hypothetical protein
MNAPAHRYDCPEAFNADRARYAAQLAQVLGSRFKPDLYGAAGGAIAQHGGNVGDAALSACLAHDLSVFPVLAAFEEATEQDPLIRAARFRRREASLRRDAAYHLTLSAEYAGKAEYRRRNGDPKLAADFQSMADASQRLSDAALAKAVVASDAADDLERHAREMAELAEVVMPA